MFDFERATDYIRSLELPGSALCEEIQKDALAGDVPIIRPETASFLLFLISLKKPFSILEVGTAVGYSAIRMSEVMPAGASITTIEKYPPRIEEAKRNFARAPRGCDITLLEGDAADILKTLDKPYDLIFMDIQMPKMDGYTATREIRTLNNHKCANIPIIAMTANAFEEDRKKAVKAGMNGHIAKPISADVILENLDQIFE